MLDSSFDFYDCRSSFHVVGEVLIIVIRIVVAEVKTLRVITLRFLDFRDVNHEDFTAKILNLLDLFA